jgi:hypothetical protein
LAVTRVLLLWLSLAPPGLSDGQLPIEPFEVGFTIYRYGLPVGEALLTLADEGGGRYSMRSDVRATGLSSLISSEQVDEWVFGEFKDGTPRPLSYRQQRAGDAPRKVTLSFDWEQGRVQANKNGRETSLALQPRVVDPLSWYLLAMSDLSHGVTAVEYELIGSDSLKTYQVQRHGEETIETPFGELNTLVISRQRQGRETAVKLWHAPQLSFLPVQVSKLDQGEEVLRMTIRELKGISLPGTPGDVP